MLLNEKNTMVVVAWSLWGTFFKYLDGSWSFYVEDIISHVLWVIFGKRLWEGRKEVFPCYFPLQMSLGCYDPRYILLFFF